MTIEIHLSPDEAARLRDRAAAAGQDVPTYVREAVFEELDRLTFAESLVPVHEGTRRTGMNADALEALADHAREEYWAGRRANRYPEP